MSAHAAALGLERQLLLLLVADAPREVRQRLAVDDRRVRRLLTGAHRVVVDHRVGDLGDALQVVGGAVVTAPKTICSATRPPRRTVIWSMSSSRS